MEHLPHDDNPSGGQRPETALEFLRLQHHAFYLLTCTFTKRPLFSCCKAKTVLRHPSYKIALWVLNFVESGEGAPLETRKQKGLVLLKATQPIGRSWQFERYAVLEGKCVSSGPEPSSSQVPSRMQLTYMCPPQSQDAGILLSCNQNLFRGESVAHLSSSYGLLVHCILFIDKRRGNTV